MPLAPDDPRLQRFGQLGFDRALAGATVTAVGEAAATVRLPVADPVLNPVGTLHGGAIATLVDDAGTLAIMAADPEGRAGVTTDLNVTYLAAARPGEAVLAEAKALKTGRTLAFVTVDIVAEHDRRLLAQGRMTKYMPRRERTSS